MGMPEPPALLRALEELHGLAPMGNSLEGLPRKRPVLAEEAERLALRGGITAPVCLSDGLLRTLGRALVIGKEAVGSTKQEMIVAGEGGVLQSCQWLALRKKQIENLLQPAERKERRGVAQAQIEASTIALPWRQALHVTLRRLECSHRLLVGVERDGLP